MSENTKDLILKLFIKIDKLEKKIDKLNKILKLPVGGSFTSKQMANKRYYLKNKEKFKIRNKEYYKKNK